MPDLTPDEVLRWIAEDGSHKATRDISRQLLQARDALRAWNRWTFGRDFAGEYHGGVLLSKTLACLPEHQGGDDE